MLNSFTSLTTLCNECKKYKESIWSCWGITKKCKFYSMSFQLHRWRKLTFRHTAERSHLATNPAREWVAWPAHLSSLLNRAWNFIFMKSREKIHFQCHVPSQKSSSPFLLTNVNPFFRCRSQFHEFQSEVRLRWFDLLWHTQREWRTKKMWDFWFW